MQLTKEDLLVLTNPIIAGMVLAAAVVTLAVLAIALPGLVVWRCVRKVAEQLRRPPAPAAVPLATAVATVAQVAAEGD